jgi:hypothetical protein
MATASGTTVWAAQTILPHYSILLAHAHHQWCEEYAKALDRAVNAELTPADFERCCLITEEIADTQEAIRCLVNRL